MSWNPPSNPPTVPADVARHLGPVPNGEAELPTVPVCEHSDYELAAIEARARGTRVCPMRSALHNKPMPHAWSRPLTADGAVGYCAMCGVDR